MPESKSGVQISVADGTVSSNLDPDYGPTECGLGTQVIIVGFDAGVEPLEILDFVTGFFFIDLRHDDL